MEESEDEIKTALREVKEEVGLDVEINIEKRYVLNYIIKDEIYKTTVLYIAVPKNENLKMQESEIEDIKWYNFDEALKILTFENWKELLKKVIKDIK